MKKKIIISLLLYSCILNSWAQEIQTGEVFQEAEQQTRLMLQEIEKVNQVKPELVSPRSLDQGQSQRSRSIAVWFKRIQPVFKQ